MPLRVTKSLFTRCARCVALGDAMCVVRPPFPSTSIVRRAQCNSTLYLSVEVLFTNNDDERAESSFIICNLDYKSIASSPAGSAACRPPLLLSSCCARPPVQAHRRKYDERLEALEFDKLLKQKDLLKQKSQGPPPRAKHGRTGKENRPAGAASQSSAGGGSAMRQTVLPVTRQRVIYRAQTF